MKRKKDNKLIIASDYKIFLAKIFNLNLKIINQIIMNH